MKHIISQFRLGCTFSSLAVRTILVIYTLKKNVVRYTTFIFNAQWTAESSSLIKNSVS